MSQTSFDMPVPIKAKAKQTKAVKRTGDMKSLPLSNQQVEWAIGHNLQWLLSIVKPEGEEVV